MIARLLSPFADARLRRDVDRLASKLADATQLVRRMDGLLRQKTAEASTNYALAERWRAIAQGAQSDLAAERARTQETQP